MVFITICFFVHYISIHSRNSMYASLQILTHTFAKYLSPVSGAQHDMILRMVGGVTLFAEFHPHSLSHTQHPTKGSLHPQAYAGGIFATIKNFPSPHRKVMGFGQ